MKLGKHTPVHDDRTLMFATYATSALPAPPPQVNYATAVTVPWGMMDNDTYGDCTCAAAGHLVLEWTANNGKPTVIPDPTILAFYNHFAHGVADAGANMLQVLKYWRSAGVGGHHITAFVAVDLKNQTQACQSVDLFGGCYIGVELPNFAVQPPAGGNLLDIPWVVPADGPVGNAAPNPQNGHCIPAVAYDQQNLYIVTWGQVKAMSWEFYNAYADEAFAVLSPDWFSAAGKAPAGFDLAQLTADLKGL